MQIYKSIATGDTAAEDFPELLPEIPKSNLPTIKPAITHALRELTRDPSHGAEYDV